MNPKAWNIRNIHVYVFQLKPLDLYSCSDRLWLAATHFSVPSIFREHNIGMQLLRSSIKSFVFTHFTIQIYMYINNAIKYVPKRQYIWNNILSIYINILCTAIYHQIAKSTHCCGSPLCLRHQLLFFILLVLVVLDYIVILPHNPISLHNILIYHVWCLWKWV